MPIHGYFEKRETRRLTMPRCDEGFPNEVGITYYGDILTGKISFQDALALEAARLRPFYPNNWVSPNGYDPVLKSHLGIK